MEKQTIDELKRIRDLIDKMIMQAEAERGHQSRVGESFQEALKDKMEMKELSKISDEL